MAKLRVFAFLLLVASFPIAVTRDAAGQIAHRPVARPYLNMPDNAQGALPARLSQTGAFADVRSLKPVAAAVAYDLVVPFWSDGASKNRFVVVPEGGIRFSPAGEWKFPAGTVFAKTFILPVDEANPDVQRRLETRLLVVDRAGGVYGVVYRWRPDLSDADLLNEAAVEPVAVRTAQRGQRVQDWYYPSREDCLTCHTGKAGGVLGVKTRQMNRDITAPSGSKENQLLAWHRLGMFSGGFDASGLETYPRLAPHDDASRSIADRARSYLDANCAHCHLPGGTVAAFDARFDTPLAQQMIVDGRVLIDAGIDRARVIAPHDPWRSIALARMDTNGDTRMPPLARQTVDTQGVALIRDWIDSMPGRPVLGPPVISPAGGEFHRSVTVTIAAAPGATVHYTLDGSAPAEQDPRYDQPIQITGPTIVRARAYRDGYTRSIAVQQTFVPGDQGLP